jgi:ubiquinone/menaquinone biosynthesis C-methylase UbiE
MSGSNERVCPVETAGTLDNSIRKWLQDPKKIAGPYVKRGMTVLDLGCGPGFFSIPMAEMVGESGKVIAADLQEGMLQKLREKIEGTEVQSRIKLHKSEADVIGVSEKVDFALAFYMVHEVPNRRDFFREVRSVLKDDGWFLMVEPKIFHVSKKQFQDTVRDAEDVGFEPVEWPRVFFSRSVLLRRNK